MAKRTPGRKPIDEQAKFDEFTLEVANYAKEHGVAKTSQKYKRDASTVYSYCNKHGIVAKRTKKLQSDQILKFIARILEGDKIADIARDMKVTHQQIHYWNKAAIESGFYKRVQKIVRQGIKDGKVPAGVAKVAKK